MAATAQDPPRTVAGREGPLKWAPDPERSREKDQWLAPDGERAPARIKFLSHLWQGETKETYYAFRNGQLLGVRRSLADAKKLAESGKADPNELVINLKADGSNDPDALPAFLALSKAERVYARKNAPPLTMPEMRTSWRNYKLAQQEKGGDFSFMAQYESMGVEQLTRAYNDLVDKARAMGLDSFRQRARFKDKDEALEAIHRIESSIRARQSSEQAAKTEARGKTGPTPREVTPASPQPEKGTDEMAKKAKKAAKKTGAKKAAAPKGPKVYERPAGKAGEFTAKIGTRPDTNKDKLALFLFGKLGKAVDVKEVAKAVYGNASEKSVGALTNVVGGLKNDIDAAKAGYHIKREDGKIGLYSGSGK